MLSLRRYIEKKGINHDFPLSTPAPSKLRFLLSRIWLKRRYKFSIFSLILITLLFFAFDLAISKLKLHQIFLSHIKGAQEVFLERPEFILNELKISVDNEKLRSEIIETIDLTFPVNSLTLNLEETRKSIEQLGAVLTAKISIDDANRLIVDVVERSPAVINKIGSRYFVLDKNGKLITEIGDRSEKPELPLFLGGDIDNSIEEGLKLLLELGIHTARVNALAWVGNRRWDILFDKNRTIKLPSSEPLKSLTKFLALDLTLNILNSSSSVIDLRNEQFLIILPKQNIVDQTSYNNDLIETGA